MLELSLKIENALKSYLDLEDEHFGVLYDSMRYSVGAGGKRVRPMLTLEFAKLCNATVEQAMPFACAVELIHTYSLIHDDLPCMDNDDMRRGKPSNHIEFGEDNALLAGDALQSLAFEIMLCDKTLAMLPAERAAKAACVLADCCGAKGMVGGQVIDLQYEDKEANGDIITKMHFLKTGALIKAACLMGCIVADADKKKQDAACKYAECIGLAFQLVDDVLDVTSTSDELGKPVNSDLENHKSTLVSLIGVEECLKKAEILTSTAINALNAFDGDTTFLKDFALKLLNRRN